MQIALTHAVADTGATSVFVMAGTPDKNICVATKPIQISLPDGTKIVSTHICDVDILGLPHKLNGHIVPDMKWHLYLAYASSAKLDARLFLMMKSVELILKATLS
jgi:hypothetical protein